MKTKLLDTFYTGRIYTLDLLKDLENDNNYVLKFNDTEIFINVSINEVEGLICDGHNYSLKACYHCKYNGENINVLRVYKILDELNVELIDRAFSTMADDTYEFLTKDMFRGEKIIYKNETYDLNLIKHFICNFYKFTSPRGQKYDHYFYNNASFEEIQKLDKNVTNRKERREFLIKNIKTDNYQQKTRLDNYIEGTCSER